MASRAIRDPALLDALDSLPRIRSSQNLWRIVREGRDPLQASSPKGRWDDGSFEMLYTACEADGAKAEIHFHVMRGQPVFPSQLRFHLHELTANVTAALKIETVAELSAFGLDAANYGSLTLSQCQAEYSPTQKLAEAAHFLGFDSLVIPSARWPSQNMVLFVEHLSGKHIQHVQDHGPVDFRGWAQKHGR